MTDVKVPSSGNIRVWWALPNAFANWQAPTTDELNACLDVSDSVSWNDFDFGLSASNTIDDPAITAIGKVSDRGAAQFGGGVSFYYPGAFGDVSNAYANTYDAMDQPRTMGYLVIRIDGDKTAQPLAAHGDMISVFKVMTDGYAEVITGEEAFRYTITFLPQGDLAVRTFVTSNSLVYVSIATLTSMTVGQKFASGINLEGRNWTVGGVKWTSSDPSVVSVSSAGVVTAVSTGTADITATHEYSNSSDTVTITVS
jgi:hypothetical protein